MICKTSVASFGKPIEAVGKIFGIHAKDTAIGDVAVLQRTGVFKDILCLSTDVVAAGDPLFWDGTRLTLVVGTNVFAGWADIAKATAITVIDLICAGGQGVKVAS